jgi:hypothetical protein
MEQVCSGAHSLFTAVSFGHGMHASSLIDPGRDGWINTSMLLMLCLNNTVRDD